jgi:hypothetical protein
MVVRALHPSNDGARATRWTCGKWQWLHVRHAGQEQSQTIQQQQVEKKYPSRWTSSQWAHRLAQSGHVNKPFQMNGNQRFTVLTRRMRFLLVYYHTILFPKCTAVAELNCYLYNNTPPEQEQRFYSGSQITRAEDDCSLTRKRGATTAWQANLPHNIAKLNQYKNENYPYGVADSNW